MPVGTNRLPGPPRLARWVELGFTQEQIVQLIEEEDGWRPARASVAAALSRAGLTQRTRYAKDLPWRVKVEHNNDYVAQMLRLEARRKAGHELNERQASRLAAFKKMLKDNDAVVTYTPELGFVGVPRRSEDGRGLIRKP